MELAERIANNQRRAAMAGLQRIMFCHVPKCAGTAVMHSVLRQAHPLRARLLLDDFVLDPVVSGPAAEAVGVPIPDLRLHLAAYHLARRECRFVGGHIFCPPHLVARFADDWRFVTLLRDPVALFVSTYVFNTYKTSSDWARNRLPIDEYLDSPVAAKVATTFLRYFSSAGGEDSPPAAEHPRLIGEAVDVLGRFTVVGTVERMDDWIGDFAAAFGPRLRIPRANESPAREEAGRIRADAGLMRRIAALCASDIAIHRAALGGGAAAPAGGAAADPDRLAS